MQLALRKHPGILIVAVIVIALLVWGFWPQPVSVEVVKVKQAPMTVAIEEEGRTRVIDRYIIAAPVNGVACSIQLKVGDPVEKGQTLLSISPLASQVLDPRSRAEAEARVAVSQSALQAAKEQASLTAVAAEFSATELQRVEKLVEQGLVSRESYDRAKTEYLTSSAAQRKANYSVEVARYELQAARTALEYSAASEDGKPPREQVPVKSPITGEVLKVPRVCEGPVQTGDTLLQVGDTSLLEVVVEVLSADAVKIMKGMEVHFERWGGDGHLEGIVRRVEPVGFTKVSALGVEEQRVQVIVDFTSPIEVWQRLGDGYRVDARFVLWHRDQVLQAPSSSLFKYQQGWAVFVVKDGRAELRQVKPGQQNGLTAQILEGLKAGDRVVSHPSDEVEPGVRVRLRQIQG